MASRGRSRRITGEGGTERARRLGNAAATGAVARAVNGGATRGGASRGGASREETLPVALGALVLASIALLVCYSRGYMLLYGDAVAHLGIARRILDSRNPGLVQLGGVWLPLSHVIMLPFIWKMPWWQNGMAGAWPSMLCYIFAVTGFFRLARRLLSPRWALVATSFFALNPNLLFLSTTAMTEPLFLAVIIWLTLLTIEGVDAMKRGAARRVRRLLLGAGLLIAAAVYTRYDGWILGAAAWCVLAWQMYKRRELWREAGLAFAIFTLIAIAAPVSWLAYNQHFYHDWLDFMRGPYSAGAIEKKTSPPGSRHYRGWHNPGWALLFYTRTAQVDAAAWETGFLLMAAALCGLWSTVRRRLELPALLLWVPLPFYVYSVAYGSVPIFIPQLWPHSFYNARYGMELLPALALFGAVAVERLQAGVEGTKPLVGRLLFPVSLSLIVLNTVAMMYQVPLVLKEGMVNATTRVAFETALAEELRSFPPGASILMSTSDHIGALQQAGIPLKQVSNESDYDSWKAALADPAARAAYVIAIAGDPVSKVLAQNSRGLTELTVLCTTGQPCARVYRSDRLAGGVAETPPR